MSAAIEIIPIGNPHELEIMTTRRAAQETLTYFEIPNPKITISLYSEPRFHQNGNSMLGQYGTNSGAAVCLPHIRASPLTKSFEARPELPTPLNYLAVLSAYVAHEVVHFAQSVLTPGCLNEIDMQTKEKNQEDNPLAHPFADHPLEIEAYDISGRVTSDLYGIKVVLQPQR